jgi:hypothetical protein
LFTFDFSEDIVGCLGPDEGMLAAVPTVDEGPDLDHQLADGGEDAAADGLAFDDGEPDLPRFNQEADVGGKCTWMRGLALSQAYTSGRLWAA